MDADTDRVSEFENHIIDVCDSKLLKVASFYGPNGGGKSNILAAILLAKEIVFNNNFPVNRENNFSCSFNNDDVISETVFFDTEKYEIGYKFDVLYKSIKQNAVDFTGRSNVLYVDSFEMVNETVVFRNIGSSEYITLFERDSTGSINSELLDNKNIPYSKVIGSTTNAVSYLYKFLLSKNDMDFYEKEVIVNLYNEIKNFYNLEVVGGINGEAAVNIISSRKDKLIKMLNDVDIKISDILINKDNRYDPFQFERLLTIDNKEERRVISLSDESRGTKKIFWMFVNLLNEEKNSRIFLCDDMNAYLHPKLSRVIVELFNSPENNDKQLIFNSHDILNMTNELFRRDEIWFAYRDDNYSTKIVPLSNIVNHNGKQVRKDANYFKQYLEGKYGADPFIKKGLEWNE